MARKKEPCFECDKATTHRHHVIPQSMGGKRTVPLCPRCHMKAHSVAISDLVKRGHNKKKLKTFATGPKRKYDWKKIRKLHEKGIGYRRIAKAIGCTKGTVQHVLKKTPDKQEYLF